MSVISLCYKTQHSGVLGNQSIRRLGTTKEDKDVADLDELVSPHRTPAEPIKLDQGEFLSNLEKELAALDATPPQAPAAQPEQHEETVVPTDPEESQHGSAAHPQKPLFYGAARLTFGQNPESVSTTTTTTTTTTTPAATTITTSTEETSDETSSLSSETVSNNGAKRSGKGPKNAEYFLRHNNGQYSSLEMAQYVFWTGDEEGVARAVEEFIQKGLMSRENAIKFLREISLGIEYLENSYANRGQNEQNAEMVRRETVATFEPTTPKIVKPTFAPLPKEIHNLPALSKINEISNEKVKDYDENTGRLRIADFLYAEYSLEEVIYQLAKVMFSQSLTRGSEQAQAALQRLTGFLESEGAHGRISPALQKKVLDVLLAALSDCLAEHPELVPIARIGLGNSFDELPNKHTLHKP
ncbi:uncharacterized protein LOC119069847 isoform X2 [Bradysia coprophila]|uniref:uncharacterized protein LOC119069847 isoform X2 n=1 Tax=Bradysia coprophila TaxID=38358 RepID=UPI00187DA1FD|nr:uncharacterized protein LOC119069847 isoform X2 [Bradysia coprophila]